MARSRRKMTKSPRRARGPRADWVYRPNFFDEAGAEVDGLGSYRPQLDTLVAGLPGANVNILYDSHNYMRSLQAAGTNFGVAAPRSHRAEGSRARILACEGYLSLRPSVWALGSTMEVGFRFGMFEQDPLNGALLLDPAYSMWAGTGNNALQPSVWANDRMWQKEERFSRIFDTAATPSRWSLHFRFPVKRSLAPNFCYAMYTEASTLSVTAIMQPWFRTLVSDEG